ncbi:MAG: c-type cytochrome [Rubrivivax sp.]|nr:c-type cytochrome [Rubrivivax sp.]
MAIRMMACTVCHGPQGRATQAGYFPRIAGKPAGYLFNQLVHFRDGRRHHAAMVDLVQHMSDAYLRDIAAHFAALDLPYAAAPPAGASAAVLVAGRHLVEQGDAARNLPPCTACHGPRMTGALPAIPGLVGLPRDYLLAQLGAWRHGERRAALPDCMAQVAQRLRPDEVEAVTLWLATQPTQGDMKPVPATALPQPLPMRCGDLGP